MIRRPIALGILLVVASAQIGNADLLIKGYTPQANDRFNGSPSFIGGGLNFSGVGKAVSTEAAYISNAAVASGGSDNAQFANLITANFALSANHDHPGVGAQVTFVSGNGSNPGASVTETVAAVMDIAGSDLELLKLSAPVDTSIIHPFAIGPAGLPPAGELMYVYGQANRVGESNIDATTAFRGFGTYDAMGAPNPTVGFSYTYDPNSPNPNESKLVSGDSGGPSFVNINGQLALIGIHYAVGTPDSTDPDPNRLPLSIDTYVPFYAGDIQAAITAMGSHDRITVVPEPTSMVLLGIGAIGMIALARRAGRAASPVA